MKKNFTALLLAGCAMVNAQENNKKNIVKLNATTLAFGNTHLSYERIIKKNLSLSINVGILAKGNIPYTSIFNIDEDLKNIKINGNTITLEPRFYFGKGYGKGFYIAPYYRYSKYKINDFIYEIELPSLNSKEPIHISGHIKGHSGGLMIGSQFYLDHKKNITLDVWMLGAHYGASRGELKGTTERTLTENEQKEAQEALDNFADIPLIKYNSTVHENGATIKIKGPWAGIRAGISLGYKF